MESLETISSQIINGILNNQNELLLCSSSNQDEILQLFKILSIDKKYRCYEPYWNVFYRNDNGIYSLYLMNGQSVRKHLTVAGDWDHPETMCKYSL